MSERKHFNSGAKWEPIVGYSRAVRVGDTIEVSGTCAVDENGNPYAVGQAYEQTKRCLEIIQTALEKLGSSMSDVVRTRMFVTDITHWPNIGKAHGEVFSDIRPVTTMVEVSRLIAPEYLVEIEATAIVSH
jgi:enamine deaminase RidA (YjgF/YER057c/UK114 family)